MALRRELAGTGVRLLETRTLADASQALESTPAAFLVLELAADAVEPVLRQVIRLARDFPAARAAVVAPHALAAWRWPACEAGAVYFAASRRQLAPLARMIVRHLAELPPPQQTLTERIWASLPWAGRGVTK